MEKNLLGVIDATTYFNNMEEIISHRSLAALPFGGRYRLIDFILSNMVNSGIESVAIFPKYQYRSLMDHVGSGKNWDLNRKRDGLFFFPSQISKKDCNGIGSFKHFAENIDYFYRSRQEYALIANCFTVANIDFKKILDEHIQSCCDITDIRKNGRSLQMYVIKTSLLIELIEQHEDMGYLCLRDVVTDIHHSLNVCSYNYTEFAEMVDSIETYYDNNMSLLNQDVWKSLFLKNQPIYTKVKDEPPTHYSKGSQVIHSVIANGCQIEGHVENSVIARGVRIGKGTTIKNCIIMQKCQIEENCVLDSVILDKDVRVESGTILSGSKDSPKVIRKGTVQGALMKS